MAALTVGNERIHHGLVTSKWGIFKGIPKIALCAVMMHGGSVYVCGWAGRQDT